MTKKSIEAYRSIGEVVKLLDIKSKKSQTIPTYTIRFWEKEFKQIKPKILNGNRRYYDEKNINIIKKIHFLLNEQGMTIKGVKKILNNKDSLKLDEMRNHSINTSNLRDRLTKISKTLKKLKNFK
jgi:DNA-binding transcriptional MerR regulator